MKHVVAALLGLVLGAAVAGAVVYFNPLAAGGGVRADGAAVWQLGYAFPGAGVLTHTHGGGLPVEPYPDGVAELWEETIRSTALTTLALDTGRDGERIWGTRITVPSPRTDLLLDGVVVADYWLISMPGAGSFFVAAESNVWPALKDTYLRVDVLRRPWQGPASYSSTLSPFASRRVVGATGRFAGQRGRAVETFEVAAYDRTRGLEALNGRLALEFDGAGPFAEPAAAAN